MLGSWLSAAMSCYLRAVETREREAGGCDVIRLSSEVARHPVRTMTAMTLATRLYTFGQSEAPTGNQWPIRGWKICTASIQFDVCDNQLDPRDTEIETQEVCNNLLCVCYKAMILSYFRSFEDLSNVFAQILSASAWSVAGDPEKSSHSSYNIWSERRMFWEMGTVS